MPEANLLPIRRPIRRLPQQIVGIQWASIKVHDTLGKYDRNQGGGFGKWLLQVSLFRSYDIILHSEVEGVEKKWMGIAVILKKSFYAVK